MSTNNDLNGIVQSIVTTLTSQLSQRPTPAQVSELIRECIEEVQLDFSRTIELCTVIPRTQSVQSGIAADVLSLNFFGTEEPSRTFRSAIELDPLLNKRYLTGFILSYIETLYLTKRPNPNVFDYLLIQDYNEVVFRAQLREETTSGYSLFFEVNRLRTSIEDKVRNQVVTLRYQRAEQAVRSEYIPAISLLIAALVVVAVAVALPPIIQATKKPN